MRRRTRYILLLCAGILFGGTVLFQLGVDRTRTDIETDTLLYLPNAQLLEHFTGGMSSIVADMLWLRCVQYVATESKGDRNFTWLNNMLSTVVQLDPYFTDAYRYGGMFLAALKADSDAGLRLLEQGVVQQPLSWELPYEAAMIFLLNRRDEPDAKRRAAYYLAMSSATGNAPELILELSEKLQGEYDLVHIERRMWTNLLESDDTLLRDLAKRKLQEVQLREACQVLQERVQIFAQTQLKPAENLQELCDVGLIRSLPPDPFGGHFFIDAQKKVQNSTLLDEKEEKHRTIIQEAIRHFAELHQRNPKSLEELVKKQMLTQIPPHPYADKTWRYNPETGTAQ